MIVTSRAMGHHGSKRIISRFISPQSVLVNYCTEQAVVLGDFNLTEEMKT